MRITGSEELTPGVIQAVFHTCKELSGDYGPACLLVFRCTEPGNKYGLEATVLCSAQTVSANSKLGKFIAALRGGQPILPTEEVDLQSYYGVAGLVTIERNEKNGRLNVASFVRQQASPAMSAAAGQPAQPPLSQTQAEVQAALQANQPAVQEPVNQQPVQQANQQPIQTPDVPF